MTDTAMTDTAMTDTAVADQVARADPDRWRGAMTAPLDKRAGLMALYAFNLEIARAPFVTSEPMLAEIRLRWWTDALAEIHAGLLPRRHEIVQPLAAAIQAAELPLTLFDEMIAARALDIDPDPFPDRASLDLYIARTSGHLTELAARHLGVPATALPILRDFAQGTGLAAYLRARPALIAQGRDALPPETEAADLARDALRLIASARARRALVPALALPALLPGALAAPRLNRALAGQDMELSDFRARATLLARGITGRW